MKKFFVFTSSLLVLMLLLSACGGGETSSSPSTDNDQDEAIELSIGTQPWIGYGPWWIAEAEGIFEKYNIDAELTTFIQDQDLNAAFASNNIQVANIATHTGMKMIANNDLDLKIITFLDESLKADAMITGEQFKSLEDLKGKKIAFEEATTSDILFRQALSDNNLKIEDFEVVFMPASDAGLALLSGNVDAAVTYEPYISTILAEDAGAHVLYSGENSPGLISDIAAVSADFYGENPEIVETLQQVWDEAMAFWSENPEKGNEIIAKESGTEPSQLPTILEGIHFFTMEEQREVVQSGDLVKKLDNIKSILESQDGLKKDVSVEEMIGIE